MAEFPFMIAKTIQAKGVCMLETIENVPNKQDLRYGVSRLQGFTPDAAFSMSPDYPKDVGLGDALDNVSGAMVVSQRLKEAMEAVPGLLFENEVLPVKIFNHKKRLEKAPYFIIHQINHPACLDEAKSKGKRMPIDPKMFQFMKEMVLDLEKIDPKKMLFRVAQFPDVRLIRREVAEQLGSGNFVGLRFKEIAGYDFL